jgi:predicted PurR-regulated permease PerM
MTEPQKKSLAPLISFLAIIALLLFVTVQMVAPYAISLFLGGALGLLAYPLYTILRRFGPRLAATAVTLGIFLLLIVPVTLFAVAAARQAVEIGNKFADSDLTLLKLSHRVTGLRLFKAMGGESPAVQVQVRATVQNAGQAVAGSVLKFVKGIPELLMQLALAAVMCFFVFLDGKRFIGWLLDKLPLEQDVQETMMQSLKTTTVSTVWAGLASSGAQALMLFLTFLSLGIPGAFLAGGVTFVLSWFPVLGCVPASVAGIVYLFVQKQFVKMAILILIALMTGVLDNVVRSWVLKGREDMHPFVGLISIIGGIGLFGIFGVFIGPIVVALLITLLKIWPLIGKRFGLTFGSDTRLS